MNFVFHLEGDRISVNFVLLILSSLCQAISSSLDFIIDTASGDHPLDPYMLLLKIGVLALVGFPSEIRLSPGSLNLVCCSFCVCTWILAHDHHGNHSSLQGRRRFLGVLLEVPRPHGKWLTSVQLIKYIQMLKLLTFSA